MQDSFVSWKVSPPPPLPCVATDYTNKSDEGYVEIVFCRVALASLFFFHEASDHESDETVHVCSDDVNVPRKTRHVNRPGNPTKVFTRTKPQHDDLPWLETLLVGPQSSSYLRYSNHPISQRVVSRATYLWWVS